VGVCFVLMCVSWMDGRVCGGFVGEMPRWDGCGWSGCVMGWLDGTVGDEEVVELTLWTLDATVS
jgi:hypothetical protein